MFRFNSNETKSFLPGQETALRPQAGVCTQVILGYTMLPTLISIFANKLARRRA